MIKPLDERECCTYRLLLEKEIIFICIETDIIYKYIYIYIQSTLGKSDYG